MKVTQAFRLSKLLPGLISLLVVSCSEVPHRVLTNEPQKTSVCEIVLTPQQFDRKSVELIATVESDFSHAVILKDKGCPRNSLPLGHERQVGAKDSSEFNAAMEKCEKRRNFIGEFLWNISYVRSEFPHAEINITDISQVRYEPSTKAGG